jgi:hypothetical protein
MSYIGQPIPSTTININQVKISDGKSVEVTVDAGSGVTAGQFAVIDGFFGVAMQTVVAAENTAGTNIVLTIEPSEYITDQVDPAKTFAKGAALYFDPARLLFTDDSAVAGAFFCGRVSSAKDAANTIQFMLYPQTVTAAASPSK